VASANARADDGIYSMLLPTDAPAKAPYVASATKLEFLPTLGAAGRYRLWASVARSAEARSEDIVLDQDPVIQDFHFAAP
jgi:hypothetical protein